MDVINLDFTNFVGLSSKYKEDDTLKFNQSVIFSEQSVYLSLSEILKEVYDSKINNYSNLFLTRKDLLTSAFSVEKLSELEDEGFSTYFAVNAAGTITPSTKFWVVQEPPISVNTANVRVSGTFTEVNNGYFFDVELLTDKFCKISHENDNIIRYLTVDYTGNLAFAKDIQLDAIGALSPQIFYYVYDRAYNYIVLIKNINDIPKFVTFNANVEGLTLVDPITGTAVPYSISSIFRVRPRNKAPNKTDLFDPWVSYNKDFKTNSQDINPDRSYDNIGSNFLINNEHYTLSGETNSIDFNVLSLKNIFTPEYYASRANPFFEEKNVEFRDYQKMYTGSYQNLGTDNISLGYESYTSNIVLKKDKITYFHIPQVFYPFLRLNINDSGLTEAGAIAGDHPLKADKIFKKKADYKYTSHFGDTAEENSGEFLCAWLSGNTDVNSKPFWVDRYYNPKKISGYQALTASDFKAIKYISNFDCLVDKAFKTFAKDVDVFDKPSDLIFEKGTYYAYHHLGPKDVDNFIKTLSNDLVIDTIPFYKFYNGSDATYYSTSIKDPNKVSEYIFDGSTYGYTTSLSSIQDSNQFTLIFDAYSSNWQKPLGNQIIGNYDRDGFGIFNENLVTPTLFVNRISGTYVTNLDYNILNNLSFNSNLRGLIRLQGMNDFYGIFQDNSFRRFNINYSETRRGYPTDPNDQIGNLRGLDYSETEARVLIGNSPGVKTLMKLDLNSHEITDITLQTTTYPRAVAKGLNKDSANSIIFYNDKMYLTQGKKAVRAKDTIFYDETPKKLLQWRDINNDSSFLPITAFTCSKDIEDFNVDFDSNLWLIYDENKFIKYSYDRVFLLSGVFTDTKDKNYTNFKIDFTADFVNGEYNTYAVVTRQSYVGERKNIEFVKMTLSGDVVSRNYFDFYCPLGIVYTAISELSAGTFTTSNTLSAQYKNGIVPKQILTSTQCNAVTSFNSSFMSNFNYVNNNCFNFSNTNYLASYIKDKYPDNSFNVRAKLTNIFNINDTVTSELTFNLSALDPGYHNFAVRFDSDGGYMYLFVDGQIQGYSEFTPRKYKFSNLIYRPFLVGSSCYSYSIPLFSYLKNNSFLATDIKIKNLYLYDTPLYDFDIIFHTRKGMNIQDIVFDAACGRRNYNEEIERYFKISPPGSKSTNYNLIIKNSGIKDAELQYALEQRIYEIINNTAPAHTKLNTIKWVE